MFERIRPPRNQQEASYDAAAAERNLSVSDRLELKTSLERAGMLQLDQTAQGPSGPLCVHSSKADYPPAPQAPEQQ
jgi:hypothetical protein